MCVENKSVATLTLKELRNVLNTLEREVALVALVLVMTGIRVDEAADLLWSDVSFDKNLMTVTNNQTGKKRYVLIFPIVKKALLELKESQDEEIYVFDYNGKKDAALRNNIPPNKWKSAFKILGMQTLKLGDLRRVFKKIMLDWGEAPEFVHNQLHGTKRMNPYYSTDPYDYEPWNEWKHLSQKPKSISYRCYHCF